MSHPPLQFPGGKRFAFTMVDDTDVATVQNVKPVYDLLYDAGMRITKTVWPVGCPEGSRNFASSQTLEDDDYRAFIIELRQRGFEVTWHCATMESSRRERTLAALDAFHATLGAYPRVHVNHSHNRENLYWGSGRVDNVLIKRFFEFVAGRPASYFLGHVRDSPYWWGDVCERHVDYARNLTFGDVNTLRANPSMPYRDPARPLVKWWFSATDAEGVSEFNELLQPRNQERLESEGGICIVATHLGKGYVRNGDVHATARARIEALSRREGWFPPVGQLLDWLRAQHEAGALPAGEWRRMQWHWIRDLVTRKVRPGGRRRRRENGEGGE